MALKFKGDMGSLSDEAKVQYNKSIDSMIAIMRYVGEEFVSNARKALRINPSLFPKGDFTNRTDNLRSSIGYFILLDGKVLDESLEGTSEGIEAAKSMLEQVKKGGLQLIGVAGMDYATLVESKGYNVMTSQKEVALVDLEADLNEYARQKGVKIINKNVLR